MHQQIGLPGFVLYPIVAIVALVVVLRNVGRWRNVGPGQDKDGPILSSADMLGADGLQSLNRGELVGFRYNLMTNATEKVMVLVELGHNSKAHILAFGDKSCLSDLVQSSISRKWLVPVELEGDFADYFRLYCSPEKQVELREFFNPETMAQFVDFCRAYDLEIFDDSLFISQAEGAQDKNDQTALIKDVEDFLRENAGVFAHL